MSQTTNEHRMLSTPRAAAPIRLEERPDGAAILQLLRDIHPELDAPAARPALQTLTIALPGAQLTMTAHI